MKNLSNTKLSQSVFYTAVLVFFIMFLALFTISLVNVIGVFETEAYSASIARL